MKRSSRRKSKAPDTKCFKEETSKQEAVVDQDEVDPSDLKLTRVLLKRRLFGMDVPSKFWLSFGLESQKR